MKFYSITLLFLVTTFLSAQTESVALGQTETVIGGQVGWLGAWAYGELPLGQRTVLRGEVGLMSTERNAASFTNLRLPFGPSLMLSPRWYYNLNKRTARDRATENNAANFISLRTQLTPGVTAFSIGRDANVKGAVSILPTWGIRRYWGKVSFETGLGVGYIHRFKEVFQAESGAHAEIHLRFGI